MTDLAENIKKIQRIQPLNPVMLELLSTMQNPASDLEAIISTDANTSATILKIANSPFYGMSGRIKSVKDACVLLGFNQLRNIIYATAMDQATGKGPHKAWNQQMRLHTTACAEIASLLAPLPQVHLDKGQCYSLGLLHQLGKLVLLSELPDLFEALIQEPQQQPEMNQTFCEAGVIIAEKWRLPPVFSACISNIRNEENSTDFHDEVHLVRCAHQLAQALGFVSTGEVLSAPASDVLSRHYPAVENDSTLSNIMDAINNHPDLGPAAKGSE